MDDPAFANRRRQAHGRVIIGCSGWQYRWWKGNFYPQDLPASRWLEFYARHFASVEINNTFYRLPAASAFDGWRERTPEGFVITIKASRYVTHLKRLRAAGPSLELLFGRAVALRDRLGPILFQLPPQLQRDDVLLREFFTALAETAPTLAPATTRPRFVVEFRHPSWYAPQVFEQCERARVAVCLHDMAGSELRDPAVGPFVYVRFHGPGGTYHGSYPLEVLRAAARRIQYWSDLGRDVYAYFNNDPSGAAVRDARALQVLTGQSVGAAA